MSLIWLHAGWRTPAQMDGPGFALGGTAFVCRFNNQWRNIETGKGTRSCFPGPATQDGFGGNPVKLVVVSVDSANIHQHSAFPVCLAN